MHGIRVYVITSEAFVESFRKEIVIAKFCIPLRVRKS